MDIFLLSAVSLFLSSRRDCLIKTEIPSQRAVKPTHSQLHIFLSFLQMLGKHRRVSINPNFIFVFIFLKDMLGQLSKSQGNCTPVSERNIRTKVESFCCEVRDVSKNGENNL